MVQENTYITRWDTGVKKDLSATQGEKVQSVQVEDLAGHPNFPELSSVEVEAGTDGVRREGGAIAKQWWLSALDLGVAPAKLDKLNTRLVRLPHLENIADAGERQQTPANVNLHTRPRPASESQHLTHGPLSPTHKL